MRQDYCDITIVLDRSGSMGAIRQDTIGGFNTFLGDQKKLPGKATITLVQFDDRYEPNYEGLDIQEATDLIPSTYEPRGSTALFDAVGKTIVRTGERLKAMAEHQRPAKVIFVVITDGMENASREYTGKLVKSMTTEQTDLYKWQFVYLGANVDAFAEADKLGVMHANSMGYSANEKGVRSLYASVSSNTSSMRSGAKPDMSWTAEQRQAQEDAK